MNEMMDMVASAVMTVARSFSIQVSETEIIRELKLWNYNEETQDIKKRYENLVKFIKEPVFLNVFYLALAQYFYPPTYNMLRECTGQGVTLHLALSIGEDTEISVADMKYGFERLKQILKLEKEIENFLYSEFYADERLAMYLTGSDNMSPLLQNTCKLSISQNQRGKYDTVGEEHSTLGLERLLKRSQAGNMKMLVQISGKNEADNVSFVREAYKNLGIPLLIIDLRKLLKSSKEQEIIYQNEIYREILFYGCCICYFINNKNANINHGIEFFWEDWIWLSEKAGQKPTCVITDDLTEITPRYNVPVFKYFLEDEHEKADIYLWEKTANKCNAVLSDNMENEYREKGLQRIKGCYTMEDIKISKKQKRKLLQLSAHIKYSSQVYGQWNMKEKYPYGRNITALFWGPSGTGKTMTAAALSGELNMPLYRVELSAVMDKYIGETEKRLENIFNICERSNVILFFDEADVLFGKRSEIKQAHDKYANSSVSYILQRMEQYQGMIILATNLKNNIDNAFLRRIKYVIDFSMPDKRTRTEIWKSGFTAEIPTEGIDMELLGEKVELSGGYIKNIILNAAFNAADEGSPVTMKHIIQGVENEYEKLGMILSGDEFGRYSKYFSDRDKMEGGDTDYGVVYGNKQYQ